MSSSRRRSASLEAASSELAGLNRELETVRGQIIAAEGAHGEVQLRPGA